MALPHPRITLARHPHSRRFTWSLQARNSKIAKKAATTFHQRGAALLDCSTAMGLDAYEAAAVRDTTGITPDYSRGPIRA